MLKINQIPTIKDVVGTNYCFFNVFPDRIKGRIIIISVMDSKSMSLEKNVFWKD